MSGLVLLLLTAGTWLWFLPGASVRLPAAPSTRRSPTALDMAAMAAGLAAALLVGGVSGVLVGIAIGVVSRMVLSRLPSEEKTDGEDVARRAPDAVDCLAACLAAGSPLWPAMVVVGEAFGEPLQTVLGGCARRHAMGSPPDQVFGPLIAEPSLSRVGRILMRSSESGSSLTHALLAAGSRMRSQRAAELDRRARAVGVKAVGPLGLCFLPAFMLLAVVPIVGSMVLEML